MKIKHIEAVKKAVIRFATSPRKLFLVAIIPVLLVSLWLARPASALVTYQNNSTGENVTGATTLSINTPTLLSTGDVVIAVITVKGGTGITITPPTNWTLRTTNDSTTNIKSVTYSAYYAPGDASGIGSGAQTFTFSTSAKAAGVIAGYSGVDKVDIVDVSGSQPNALATAMTAPSITTTQPNTMLVGAYGSGTNTTFTAGSSMNIRATATNSGGGGATTKVTTGIQDILQAGTGATGSKTMNAASGAVNVGHLLALRPAPNVSLASYRFFQNTDSTSAATPLATQDSPAVVQKGVPFRLRFNLGVGSTGTNATAATGRGYWLEYALRGSDNSCDASWTGETYYTVSNSTPVQFFDNPTPANGAPYATSANDPTRSGISAIAQKYQEGFPFTTATTVPAGQDGLWDIALNIGSANYGETYCLRVTRSSTANDYLPGGYTVLPQLTIATPTVAQANYGWFTNADSATPGAPLAAQDTAASVAPQTPVRLRQRLAVNVSQIPINYANYKLQYAEKSGVCDTGFSGETYTDVAPITSQSVLTNNNESLNAGGSGAEIAWLNDTNGWGINNGLYASHNAPNATGITNSYWLRSQGFSANVPTTATINGIEVMVISEVVSGADATFTDVRLARAGVIESVGKTPGTIVPYNAFATTTFGSPTDLWGASWTPSDVNNYYFGAAIKTQLTAQGSYGTLDVDAFQIKIYYTDSGGATGAVTYYNNPTPADLATVSSSGNDPTNGARPSVYQSYRETDPFTNNVATIPNGSDGLWDFAINTNSSVAGRTYCFRVVKSDHTLLDSYSQIPEITFSGGGGSGPTVDQKLRGGQSLQNGVKTPFDL